MTVNNFFFFSSFCSFFSLLYRAVSHLSILSSFWGALHRKCDPKIINKNLDKIKEFAKDIPFISKNSFNVTDEQSIVNSKFFVERTLDIENEYDDSWCLGNPLPEGHEWLAFTFNEQKINIEKYNNSFNELIDFSEEKLKDAYGRMKIKNHPWAQGHNKEINTIITETKIPSNAEILDMGCGIGRHAIEFAQKNYHVDAIDFSKKHITKAKKQGRNLA